MSTQKHGISVQYLYNKMAAILFTKWNAIGKPNNTGKLNTIVKLSRGLPLEYRSCRLLLLTFNAFLVVCHLLGWVNFYGLSLSKAPGCPFLEPPGVWIHSKSRMSRFHIWMGLIWCGSECAGLDDESWSLRKKICKWNIIGVVLSRTWWQVCGSWLGVIPVANNSN